MPSNGRRRARTDSTPSSPSRRGRSVSSWTSMPPAALESHRSPRADGRRSGRDAGQPAEQHRAKEPQVPVGDQTRAPAGSWLTSFAQQWSQRTAADRQLVALSQPLCDIERVSREHRVALEHQLAVQVDLRHGRDPVEAQAHLFARCDRLGVEARAPPPVLGVEVEIAQVARAPAARVTQSSGRRAGHARGQPCEPVERGRVGMGVGRAGRGLPAFAEHDLARDPPRRTRGGATRRRLLRQAHRPVPRTPRPTRPPAPRSPALGQTRGAARA